MTDPRHDGPNAEAIEAWDTVLFEKFTRFRHLLGDGLGIHGDAALADGPASPGARVLDVGCGFGDTSTLLASKVGRSGRVVGVDAAPSFIDVAGKEAATSGADNLRFEVRDVQTDDLGGPYDLVFSRFGTMFFASPVQALRNVHRALAPGGMLRMVVWRKREDNPWLHDAEQIAREHVPEEKETSDAVTCGPGPFSMAGADLLTDQLKKAGFDRISLRRHDAPIAIGRNVDDAIEFAIALGPAGEILRLAGDFGEAKKPLVIEALRARFGPLAGPDGTLRAGSSTWIVTAWRPGT